MSTIKGLLKKFEVLDTDELAASAMTVTEPDFVDLNQKQMYSGKRADGTDINPPYAKLTIEIKTSKGQPTDRVTLRDTGSFYEGMYMKVEGNQMVEGSTDLKSINLQGTYSEKIFGLGGSFKKEYIDEWLRPVFIGGIKQATGLK